MILRHYYPALLFAAALFASLFVASAQGAYLNHVSDLITESAPSVDSRHTIQFTATTAVPASGYIVITPEDGSFTIPSGYDYTNVHFSLWDTASSTYVDQPVAPSNSSTNNGVAVAVGTSGSITINLSSSQGLAAGDKVRILLDPITNPSTDGSHRIEIDTKDTSGTVIDYLSDIVAIIQPITLTGGVILAFPTISNALPSGTIAAGNPVIELSFNTDTFSTCRYSLTPGVDYSSMTNTFPQTNSQLFFLVLNGFQDNTTYTYYLRCKSVQGAINTADYPLSFSLAPTPSSNTSVTQSGGGTVGVGSYPNGSNVLYLANITLTGFAAPGSTVEILKDGSQVLAAQSQSDGSFHANISNLERGTYGFSLYSIDSSGRKSASYAATLAVAGGTSNFISNIVLPPSISLVNDSISVGASATVTGSAPPGSSVTVLMTPQGTGSPVTLTATSSSSGAWSVTTDSLAGGGYIFKANLLFGTTLSDYSVPVSLGVGQAPSKIVGGNRADINHDGKVNLIDFSILLSAWGTANTSTDLNDDGNTNLADFSILLFNWTG